MRGLIKQFSKFLVVGGIAFVIDWSTMTFLTEVFGIHYLISTTAGFVVSVVFNYIASMRYVFKPKEGMSRTKEFIIFIFLSTLGLGVNNLAMAVLVDMIGIDYRLAKIIATAVVTLYNFITRKLFLDAGSTASVTFDDE